MSLFQSDSPIYNITGYSLLKFHDIHYLCIHIGEERMNYYNSVIDRIESLLFCWMSFFGSALPTLPTLNLK